MPRFELQPAEAEPLFGFLAQESCAMVLLRIDREERVLAANEALKGLLLDPGGIIGRPLAEVLRGPDGRTPLRLEAQPEGAPRVWSLQGAKALGASLRGCWWPSGETRLLVAEVLPAARNEALDVLSSTSSELAHLVRDLRRRAEEKATALQEESLHLHSAEALASLGWWDWDLVSGRNIWSDNLFRIYGLEPGSVQPGYPAWQGLIHPEDRAAVVAAVSEAVARQVDLDFEWRVVHPDGSVRWLLSRACPHRNPQGEAVRYTGVVLDVTSRREAQARLRASEETFNRAFMAAPMLMTLSRLEDGTFLEVNEQFCLTSGYRREECLGRTSVEVGWLRQEDRAALALALAQDGSARNREITGRSKAGAPVHCLLSAEILLVGTEGLLLVLAADITQLRRVEEDRRSLEGQLNHLQRLETVGRLAGGVAHDMNNVLASIMAVGSLMKQRPGDAGLVQRNADLLLQAAGRARELVKDLRDFSRKELESAQAVDLNALAGREMELLERTTLKRIDLALDLDPQLPPVFGDPAAISNALMNLALNACDAMPNGGRLLFCTRRLGQGFVELEVVDSGEGMPPEVMARALEPFFTTKPAGKGTGLGLSQVYGTMKAHGGTVELRSQPGAGTHVRLVFPAWRPTAPAADAAEPPQLPTTPSRSILVVDDEDVVRRTLVELLEVLGHRASASQGGREAIDRLQAGESFDLIILDLNMPGLDGGETLARLRRAHPRQRVLLATGYSDLRVAEILKRFPDVPLLTKPFGIPELTRALVEAT